MGILLNLTEEYFKDEKRSEDMTEFDKYLDEVEWVDLGHPKYLFAKKDFCEDYTQEYDSKNFLTTYDLYEYTKDIKSRYKFITKDVMLWLLENTSIDWDYFTTNSGNITLQRIILKKDDKDIEINMFHQGVSNFETGTPRVRFRYAYEFEKKDDKYYVSWFEINPYNIKGNVYEKELEIVDFPKLSLFKIKILKTK